MVAPLRPYAAILEAARIGHPATASADGNRHVVPICYAFTDNAVYSAIDEKPKTSAPSYHKRMKTISENPLSAVVIDSYSEDWDELGYLLIRGRAQVLHGGKEHTRAVSLLHQRYAQYTDLRLEERPTIRITPTTVAAWGRAKAR